MNEIDKKEINNSIKYNLSKPVMVAGKTFREIELDFDNLTGHDFKRLSKIKEVREEAINGVIELSPTYQLNVVASASKININELLAFPLKDVTQLKLKALDFLLETHSEASDL